MHSRFALLEDSPTDLAANFMIAVAITTLGLIGFVFFAGLAERQLELRDERPDWPTVQGHVIASNAEVLRYDYSKSMYVRVSFDYKVAGRSYSATQSWEGGCAGCTEENAEREESAVLSQISADRILQSVRSQ